MIRTMFIKRKQIWLARGAAAVLVIQIILLLLSDIQVSMVKTENTTRYALPLTLLSSICVLGITTGILAAFYWMQRKFLFRVIALVLSPLTLFIFFHIPTVFNQYITITQESFHQRSGPWYAPDDIEIPFDSLIYLVVKDGNESNYELHAFLKGGNKLSIPIDNLMKKALPEVLTRAEQHDIVLGLGADGLPIPAALREQ